MGRAEVAIDRFQHAAHALATVVADELVGARRRNGDGRLSRALERPPHGAPRLG